ncbi:hypothetical protein K461DRAFT_290340 [Myriangium duriaei CBS 260.36]|uniref:Mitochondrial import inner membrane translocase subunit n=1 Tax=Myriangium duriaei CBS 260.36 TaxID=1168546 RepID=A0A9P4JFK4_9PEZI|nr:hypothetical protein K461DRAFT_290340 [Myriangium duriaei CBS 260.36]
MDSLSSSAADIDPSKLSPAERQDLQQFAMAESQKARLQGSIHNLTDVCFRKCVSKIGSGPLDKYEEPCVKNCVDRFMDANVAVLRHLESLRTR